MNEQMQESCIREKEKSTCTSVTSQYADVSVPLKLNPYAIVGNLVTECCGEPIVSLRSCQDGNCSSGCEITITQTVCIKIPLTYGAEADSGDITVICKRRTNCGGNNINVCCR
ncbi:MAG: hypothetical protein RR332_02610 [Clostridiales bacterium]